MNRKLPGGGFPPIVERKATSRDAKARRKKFDSSNILTIDDIVQRDREDGAEVNVVVRR